MDKSELLDKLAPCSLFCYTCPGYKKGVICGLSRQLDNYYRGYHSFLANNLPDEYQWVTQDFDKFKEQLEKNTAGNCDGCRNNPNPACTIKGCFIEECTSAHNVDFCGECKEFPCGKVTLDLFSQINYDRYMRGSRRIAEIGADLFFEELKDVSHFIDFE